MKNKLLVFVLILFVLPVVIAQPIQDFGTFKQSTVIDLQQVCGNSSGPCDLCNITSFKSPNSTIIIQDKSMTKRGYDFNYTLNVSQTNSLGEHIVKGFCKAGNEFEVFTYELTINKSGFELSTAQGIIYVIVFVGGFFVFCLLIFGAIKIPWKNGRNEEDRIISINHFKYVKIILFCFSYLILMLIVSIGNDITGSFLSLGGASGLFSIFYLTMLSATFPLFICVGIFTIIVFFEDQKFQKLLERGISPE